MPVEVGNHLCHMATVLVEGSDAVEDSVGIASIEGLDNALLTGLPFRTCWLLVRLYTLREDHDHALFRYSMGRLAGPVESAHLLVIWIASSPASGLCLGFDVPCLPWSLLSAYE